MTHGRETIAALKTQLAQLPPVERTKLTTRELVREMGREIELLRTRGYSIEAIAGLLTERGVKITPGTLRSYRSQVRGRKKPRKGLRT
jgi:hypothetical protein